MNGPTNPNPKTSPGTRVRVIADCANYRPIAAGTIGIIRYVSSVSHATFNGGGFDVSVYFEGQRWPRWSGDPEIGTIEDGSDTALIRSTNLEIID